MNSDPAKASLDRDARIIANQMLTILRPDCTIAVAAAILAAAERRVSDAHASAIEWANRDSPEKCECHERDGSYTCDYCKSQGYYGHMENKERSGILNRRRDLTAKKNARLQ